MYDSCEEVEEFIESVSTRDWTDVEAAIKNRVAKHLPGKPQFITNQYGADEIFPGDPGRKYERIGGRLQKL